MVLIKDLHPNTQTTVVAIEALIRFREAVSFEGVQDLRVQISAPKRALSIEWLINQNNAYQQRSAKVRCGSVAKNHVPANLLPQDYLTPLVIPSLC